jgi:lipopolysaccharide biosynthesis glycosyltransferase
MGTSASTLNIFFTLNAAYVGILATCIGSILKTSDESDQFRFFILHGGLEDADQHLLEQLKTIKNFQIKYIRVNQDDFKAVPDSSLAHISKETNYRFCLASLEPDLDKALFLDADLVVLNSLAELWNTEMDGYYMACVTDQHALTPNSWAACLGLPDDYSYVNTGVMLTNLKKWRQDGVQSRLFEAAEIYAPKLHFPDQDALNIVLHKAVLPISHKWNFMPTQDYRRLDQRAEALTDTRIIHWAGPRKPWEQYTPYNEIFWQFARLTPFHDSLLSRFFCRQSEAISQLQTKLDHLEARLQRIGAVTSDLSPHPALVIKHNLFRLLSKITFGKIREQCVRQRRHYANRRKAVKSVLPSPHSS